MLRFVSSRTALASPVLLASLAPPASAQPLPDRWTVIVHGRTTTDYATLTSPTSTGSNWMWSVANRIGGLGAPVNIYRMAIDDFSSLTTINAGAGGGTTPADPTRHHIVLFDWTATSNLISGTAGLDDGYAYAAGDAVLALLHQFGAGAPRLVFLGVEVRRHGRTPFAGPQLRPVHIRRQHAPNEHLRPRMARRAGCQMWAVISTIQMRVADRNVHARPTFASQRKPAGLNERAALPKFTRPWPVLPSRARRGRRNRYPQVR